MAELQIQTERVDDVPHLLAQQVRMGTPEVLNLVAKPQATAAD